MKYFYKNNLSLCIIKINYIINLENHFLHLNKFGKTYKTKIISKLDLVLQISLILICYFLHHKYTRNAKIPVSERISSTKTHSSGAWRL